MSGQRLNAALRRASAAPRLLVATDFDGTLAPLVDDPAVSRVTDTIAAVLPRLHASPGVSVAVISGRSYADLARRLGDLQGLTMIGSYGAEHLAPSTPSVGTRDALAEAARAFLGIAASSPGARVERKTWGVALHVRGMAPADRGRTLDAAARALPQSRGLVPRRGHDVLELTPDGMDKGRALSALIAAVAPDAVVCIGDDRADEQLFAAAPAGSVCIKVGPGPTAAPYRVADTEEVASVLGALVRPA